ncbi:hypothetical protein HZC09_05975 [Candidatus Micrarchaeota archaeon]|nr:hypothetical protein [Candidatus Micrarchaeota archaeon]
MVTDPACVSDLASPKSKLREVLKKQQTDPLVAKALDNFFDEVSRADYFLIPPKEEEGSYVMPALQRNLAKAIEEIQEEARVKRTVSEESIYGPGVQSAFPTGYVPGSNHVVSPPPGGWPVFIKWVPGEQAQFRVADTGIPLGKGVSLNIRDLLRGAMSLDVSMPTGGASDRGSVSARLSFGKNPEGKLAVQRFTLGYNFRGQYRTSSGLSRASLELARNSEGKIHFSGLSVAFDMQGEREASVDYQNSPDGWSKLLTLSYGDNGPVIPSGAKAGSKLTRASAVFDMKKGGLASLTMFFVEEEQASKSSWEERAGPGGFSSTQTDVSKSGKGNFVIHYGSKDSISGLLGLEGGSRSGGRLPSYGGGRGWQQYNGNIPVIPPLQSQQGYLFSSDATPDDFIRELAYHSLPKPTDTVIARIMKLKEFESQNLVINGKPYRVDRVENNKLNMYQQGDEPQPGLQEEKYVWFAYSKAGEEYGSTQTEEVTIGGGAAGPFGPFFSEVSVFSEQYSSSAKQTYLLGFNPSKPSQMVFFAGMDSRGKGGEQVGALLEFKTGKPGLGLERFYLAYSLPDVQSVRTVTQEEGNTVRQQAGERPALSKISLELAPRASSSGGKQVFDYRLSFFPVLKTKEALATLPVVFVTREGKRGLVFDSQPTAAALAELVFNDPKALQALQQKYGNEVDVFALRSVVENVLASAFDPNVRLDPQMVAQVAKVPEAQAAFMLAQAQEEKKDLAVLDLRKLQAPDSKHSLADTCKISDEENKADCVFPVGYRSEDNKQLQERLSLIYALMDIQLQAGKEAALVSITTSANDISSSNVVPSGEKLAEATFKTSLCSRNYGNLAFDLKKQASPSAFKAGKKDSGSLFGLKELKEKPWYS